MYMLISNDDGYQATGIVALARALDDLGRIAVVAPDRNRSGASHSLTLNSPIRALRHANGFTAVDGTPTDCVHLALNGLLTEEPDMVVCGINSGANMGDDVHYSGTVAGAMEGRFLGYPAVAISLTSHQPEHFSTAARVAKLLVERLRGDPPPRDTILNVNVPDLPWAALAGWQATRLGNRHKSEPIIADTDPRGNTCYWVGPPGAQQDAGPGTDFYAVTNGYVSVTPLQVDLTRYDTLSELDNWLQQCSRE
jgi:5'-nucleotidase